jgi:hypothetical protein
MEPALAKIVGRGSVLVLVRGDKLGRSVLSVNNENLIDG